LGREDRILCLNVDGEPHASDLPGREEEECFPPALRFRVGPDGNLSDARTEPIAADAREGRDGKRRAKLKLIAGLLGVGFDLLRRREQQRFNRACPYSLAPS
jgi:eukaryotic-like serine/threonine-protein kinase